MKKHTLSATMRDLVGRKVKNLKKQGLIPASVYGKKIKSVSISVKAEELLKVYKEAGESGLVELSLQNEVRPVLIHNVQINPVTSVPIHVEFYQVDLKEKVQANVPVEFTGEPLAVTSKVGVLLTIHDEVEVEALPADLPEKLEFDVTALAEVNAEVKVKDLVVPKGVTVLTEAELVLAKIGSLISKEAEAEEAAAEAAAAAAATTAEAGSEAGAATPAEGAPSSDATQDKKEEAKKE